MTSTIYVSDMESIVWDLFIWIGWDKSQHYVEEIVRRILRYTSVCMEKEKCFETDQLDTMYLASEESFIFCL